LELNVKQAPSRGVALGALALAPCVALLAPTSGLTSPSGDPTAPLLALVGLVAWSLTGWLLLLVLLTWGSGLPGAVGRGAARCARWVAPASVRSLVRVAVGTTLAVTVLGAPTAAFADDTPTQVPTIAGSASDPLDWPGVAAGLSPSASPTVDPSPSLAPTPAASASPTPTALGPTAVVTPAGRPTAALSVDGDALVSPTSGPSRSTAAAPPTAAARSAVPGDDVVVAPGDTLWDLAAAELGPDATDRQVAQAWPQWWSANRAAIGTDPDLLVPGTHLSVPQA
jgi:hypothetical protein